jgi:hypothetical protein
MGHHSTAIMQFNRERNIMYVKKEQQIQPHRFFHTPARWSEVEGWINRHPAEDRIHLMTAALMTWNLACSGMPWHGSDAWLEQNEKEST